MPRRSAGIATTPAWVSAAASECSAAPCGHTEDEAEVRVRPFVLLPAQRAYRSRPSHAADCPHTPAQRAAVRTSPTASSLISRTILLPSVDSMRETACNRRRVVSIKAKRASTHAAYRLVERAVRHCYAGNALVLVLEVFLERLVDGAGWHFTLKTKAAHRPVLGCLENLQRNVSGPSVQSQALAPRLGSQLDIETSERAGLRSVFQRCRYCPPCCAVVACAAACAGACAALSGIKTCGPSPKQHENLIRRDRCSSRTDRGVYRGGRWALRAQNEMVGAYDWPYITVRSSWSC